ncbi:MAG: hypothetical protein C0594_07815, partial [Marinilabiliales bacterium]
AGVYEIVMMDINRNEGVENIPGSVNVPFTIKTTLMINPQLGSNSTPILLNPPIDRAAKDKIFIHNPAAYDPDGDSLAYKLSVCLGFDGEEIDGYMLPPASDSIVVDEYTGDLIWNTPIHEGIYNVAIIIEEWRDDIKIGEIVRDMQIEVYEDENHPPDIPTIIDTCVIADSTLHIEVTATDTDGDMITLTAWGGPISMDESPADFVQTQSFPGSAKAQFMWNTNCLHIRQQPYQVVFKAQDSDDDLDLVDLESVKIQVICPAPNLHTAEPTNNSVKLSWSPSSCSNVNGYEVYRKTGPYPYDLGHCETGVPPYTGYQYIGRTTNWSDTIFTDDNGGLGLMQGYEYCYRIVAFFPDKAKSQSSNELCTELIRGIPIITKVSVDSSSTTHGSIDLEWSKPIDFDSVLAAGPYKYLIYRSNDHWGTNLSLIDSLDNINDTIYYDSLLNTEDYPYSYKIEFYNDGPQGRFLIGSPQVASSVFIKTEEMDNSLNLIIDKNVPWKNERYTVYRKNNITLQFDSIGYSDTTYYTDYDLINGSEYCYRVKSTGGYNIDQVVNPIINYSQITCGTPQDTVPSCPPQLNVTSDCDSLRRNILQWTNPNNSCSDDVVEYYIWYSPTLQNDLMVIDTIRPATNTQYVHFPQSSMAGCYMITAIDSFGNESAGIKKCIDYCEYYELPNIFTPNGDGINDIYKPGPYYFVEKVDMKIFNRWGQLVFRTDDPDINWDGRHQENNAPVTSGVYFYICDVYEHRLTGIEPRIITGFIEVLTHPVKQQE